MSGLYVASNVGAIGAMYTLQRNNAALGETLTRLSTGLRINSGKDDPAGLIASELLKSDISATEQAVKNTQRANSMIAVADSALSQVGTLLNDIRVLVNEGANTGAMSDDQIAANQLQIDASIDSIDRIAKTTNFQGKKLLDGSLDFNTTGIDGNKVSNINIQQANFGTADNLAVKINVMQEARKGTLIFNGTGVGTDTVLEIGGSQGSEIFKFGAGTTNAEMAEAINRVKDSTGVEAYVEGVAQRGNVILHSAGANNDILVTANEAGFEEGNYTFRITQGNTNDARIVSGPDASKPGVVEIQLQGSYEKAYKDFGGMFDITINTDWAPGGLGDADGADRQATSIHMTRGTANTVEFFEDDALATGTTSSGITATLTATAANSHQSAYNGWTVVIDNGIAVGSGTVDQDSKTIRVNSADADDTNAAAGGALSKLLDQAVGGDATATGVSALSITGGTLKSGDSFTLGGGGDAGELFITYKEGATVGEIQTLINNAPNVQATLKSGVSGDDLVKNLPNGEMYVSTASAAGANTMSKYSSGATSQDVIDLINSKLGDKFTAVALSGDNTNGRVSYQDASVVYGDPNLDNAVVFSGMDSGPIVRLVTGSANQSLGVTIRQPSDADIAAGVHTPILEIQLATDASGNSTTTAKQLADFFDTLTPEQTLGVSAEVYYANGVDPNGRTWVEDGCGNTSIVEDCGADYGSGIVQPTGVAGDCDVTQNDLILLGNNQATVASQASAGISSATTITAVNAVSADDGSGGTNALTFNGTSALNGVTFGYTFDETKEGFDETTGTLTMFIDAKTAALTVVADQNAAVTTIIDSAIAANWEAITAYNGATGGPVKVTSITSGAAALDDAASGGKTVIPPSYSTVVGEPGTRGVGVNDPALTITAKQSGTDWAGVKIYFEQDDTRAAYNNTDTSMDISVSYKELEDGTKALVVKGNVSGGDSTSVNAVALMNALNSNETFNEYFTAAASLKNPGTAGTIALGDAIGRIAFSADPTKAAGTTSGGYRIDSSASNAGSYTGTSSGISMYGQSDSSERLVLKATEYGSAHFVDVNVVKGTFNTYCPLGLQMDHLAGTDVVASVNGQKAEGTGTNISVSSSSLQMSADVGGMKTGESTEFTINGGGATFQIGPDVVSSQQITLGIKSVNSTNLGGASGLLYQLKTGENASLRNDTKLADRIVQEAISSIANTRGRLGAIQKSTFEPNILVLEDTIEQLSAAEALISNADFAVESSNLTRLQLLVQSASTALSLANQTPQYAARLVG